MGINQVPFNRYAYTIDYDSEEIQQPDVFLVDNRLRTLGILYPVSDLTELLNMNTADEISFSIYKYVNEKKNEYYDRLNNGSIIHVHDKYYEVKVNEMDKPEGAVKSASGTELPYVELGNRLVTLEVNNEKDVVTKEYIDEDASINFPTVFYRNIDSYINYNDWETGITDTSKKKILKESSLLHRILSFAPNYQIGHVDESLNFVNKQFSWNNQKVLDVLNEVAEEVKCVFTFTITRNKNGDVKRLLNAYDINYCADCYKNAMSKLTTAKTFNTSDFRSITNGICDHCHSSTHVHDIGEDTGILITTENLSEEMTLEPKDDIVNCVKIEAGDDLMTNITEGQLMGGNRITMFSNEQKDNMSPELRNTLDNYYEEYDSNEAYFNELRKTQYNIEDLIQYLKSSKMPTIEQNERTLQEEVRYIFSSILADYGCLFYISNYDKFINSSRYTLSASVIKNMFTLYLDKGYSVRITNGKLDELEKDSNGQLRWNGTIRIYESGKIDDVYADIECYSDKTKSTKITYSTVTNNAGELFSETNSTFGINLVFGDTSSDQYKKYIEQYCHQLLETNEVSLYKNEEEKEWKLYSYERLVAYYDGYQSCIEALQELRSQALSPEDTIDPIITSYQTIQEHISSQMDILVNQIKALYCFAGREPDEAVFNGEPECGINDALSSLISSTVFGENALIGTVPYNCNDCGSSLVGINDTGNYCISCKSTNITTYHNIASQIYNFWKEHSYGVSSTEYKPLNGEYFRDYRVTRYYINPSYSYIMEIKKDNSILITDSENEIEPIFSTIDSTASSLIFEGSILFDNTFNEHYVDVITTADENVVHTVCDGGILALPKPDFPMAVYDKYLQFISYDAKPEKNKLWYGILIWKNNREDESYSSINAYATDSNNPIPSELYGKYLWTYGNNINIKYAIKRDSYISVQEQIATLIEKFDMRSYLGETLYGELNTFIREDVYSNSNYTSDNCNNNTELLKRANELIAKAKSSLAESCVQQYTISSSIGAIVVQKWKNGAKDIVDYFHEFKLGNWIRARLNNNKDFYKLRVTQIKIPYANDITNVEVEFSDVKRSIYNGLSDIQSILSQANGINHSFDYYASQAEQGSHANATFNKLKQEGLDAALMAIKAGDDQSVVVDNHGILLRHFDRELDDYDRFQMQLINRNIVMTSDYWKTASLAIGLGSYEGRLCYGIWADVLVGNIIAGEKLVISNGDGGVVIDGNGITLNAARITWTKKLQISTISGLEDHLNQLDGRIESFSQTSDPSINWTSSAEKEKHKGDLWFNPNDGLTKQWNGSSWGIVTDSNLEKLAKSKAQIFTAQPTTPYYKGDLWVQGTDTDTDGEILRCITSRESGDFTDSDWEKASKYTDDTKALEALEKAKKGIQDAADAMDTIATLDTAVANYLGLEGSSTMLDETFIISPYIGGGYLNITGNGYRAIIDPQGKTGTNYIFTIYDTKSSEAIAYVDNSGNAGFKGNIVATSLELDSGVSVPSNKISGNIPYSQISDTPTIPKNVTDLIGSQDILYTTSVEKSNATIDKNGVRIRTIKVGDYEWEVFDDTSDFLVVGKGKGKNHQGQGTDPTKGYFSVSKDGLLVADNALIYGTIYATNGEFTGKITATSGEIGGMEITNVGLQYKKTAIGKGDGGFIIDTDQKTLEQYQFINFSMPPDNNWSMKGYYTNLTYDGIEIGSVFTDVKKYQNGTYNVDKVKIFSINHDGIVGLQKFNGASVSSNGIAFEDTYGLTRGYKIIYNNSNSFTSSLGVQLITDIVLDSYKRIKIFYVNNNGYSGMSEVYNNGAKSFSTPLTISTDSGWEQCSMFRFDNSSHEFSVGLTVQKQITANGVSNFSNNTRYINVTRIEGYYD